MSWIYTGRAGTRVQARSKKSVNILIAPTPDNMSKLQINHFNAFDLSTQTSTSFACIGWQSTHLLPAGIVRHDAAHALAPKMVVHVKLITNHQVCSVHALSLVVKPYLKKCLVASNTMRQMPDSRDRMVSRPHHCEAQKLRGLTPTHRWACYPIPSSWHFRVKVLRPTPRR